MMWSNGLQFECTQCHACCRHDPGYVFLSQADIDNLVTETRLTEGDFLGRYTRCVDLGSGPIISLKEKNNFDCVFWEGGCTVYQGRPLQCRAYPFWGKVVLSEASWKQEARFCPGIGTGKVHASGDIKQWLNRMKANSPGICTLP